ncbi:MAG: DUF2167 domain-containing protein [Hyphomicrobiaceae bacterium]
MRILALACLVLPISLQPLHAKTFAELFPGVSYQNAEAQTFVAGLDYRQGEIRLAEAKATLNVPDGFYFLGAGDARKVLVDLWGNPPANADGVLGMLFPAASTPVDSDAWGATITYSAEGYVSDDDAKNLDYDDLLVSMRASTEEANAERQKAGYETITLIGWASPPYYDQPQHKLHWGRELKFGTATEHSVNYDVRALGRNGVLELSFITDMTGLDGVKTAMPDVLKIANFDAGARYEDFDPNLDTVAAYGVGGLIAGVAAKKLGLLALALVFLKKFAAIIIVGAAVALGAIWKMITGRGKVPPPEHPTTT